MFSTVTYTGNGATTAFNVPFPYINQTDVSVTVSGLVPTFSWLSSTQIQITPAPANGAQVYIFRTTNLATASVSFADGYTLRAADLNSANTQLLYSAQESQDQTTSLVNSARVQAGNLPVVTTANNGSVLSVSAGTWVATPVTGAGGLVYNTGGAYSTLALGGGLLLSGSTLLVRGFQVLAADPGSPAGGDTWYNSTTLSQRFFSLNSIQAVVGKLTVATADGATASNTTSPTISGPFVTIPANSITVGQVIRIRFNGIYQSAGASPTLSVEIGSGSVFDTSTNAIGTATFGKFTGEIVMTVLSVGSAGKLAWHGYLHMSGSTGNLTSQFGPASYTTPSPTLAFNTTIQNQFFIALQWSVASASNNARIAGLSAEIMN